MRAWLIVAVALCLGALAPAAHAAVDNNAYVPCSDHLKSADPVWSSIASRICTSLNEAARLTKVRDTPEGKQAIHQLYLDTFNVDTLVKHVTPLCIRQWGKLTTKQVRRIVEKEVYERISSFVLDRPDDFKNDQNAGLQIGPLGKKPGQLLTKIVTQGHGDVDITWDFVCEGNDCEVVDITVLSATLSDQVKGSLQARCHR